MSQARGARRPVAMLTHSYYDEDARVRREAEALVASGRQVTVFALRPPGAPSAGALAGVEVIRLGVERHQGAGLGTYLVEYLAFTARAAFTLARAHRRRRFGLVVVHSIPDFLAFAALPVKLVGTPLVLDLHEAMPEFFRSRFGARMPRPLAAIAMALLRVQERASIALADRVVTVNDALGDRLEDIGVSRAKIAIVPNSPSLRLFDPARHARRAFAADGVVRLVYTGALSPTYEVDVAVQALHAARVARPDVAIELDLYGRDFGEVPLAALAAELGESDRVRLHGRIPLDEVPAVVAAADIGLAPTRRNAFTDYSLSGKLFEYAAMGKPVVASRLPLVERTFGADAVMTYAPGDADDMAQAILRLVDEPADREARALRAAAVAAERSWENLAPGYVALVDELARDR